MTVSVALWSAVMMGLTVAANVFIKLGAVKAGRQGLSEPFMTPEVLLGIACFGGSLLIYIQVLRTVPLNVAQSLLAFQFVGVIAASAIVLAEPIGPARWLGIALIVTGILIVAWTQTSS